MGGLDDGVVWLLYVAEEVSHLVLVRVDGGLHHSGVAGFVELLVAWVFGVETGGQVLFCNHFSMFFNWEHFCFLMYVVHTGHSVAASGCSEGMVLDGLEFGSVGGTDVWGPDRRGIFKDRSAYRFVGQDHGFLVLAPAGSGQCLYDVELGLGLGDRALDVMRVSVH